MYGYINLCRKHFKTSHLLSTYKDKLTYSKTFTRCRPYPWESSLRSTSNHYRTATCEFLLKTAITRRFMRETVHYNGGLNHTLVLGRYSVFLY